MSTVQHINEELTTLPSELQRKVLAFVEWLKYKEAVQKAGALAIELKSIQTFTEEDAYQLFEHNVEKLSPEELQEKIAIAERVQEALGRMKNGVPGISNENMKDQAKQWRKQ